MAAANNPFFIEPANPLQALMTGVQGYDRSTKAAKEAETLAGRQEAMTALQGGGDTRSALARLIGIGDVQGAKAIADFAENEANRGFRQQESQRAQRNADRSFGLQQQQFGLAQQQANRPEVVMVEDPESGVKVPYLRDRISGTVRPMMAGQQPQAQPQVQPQVQSQAPLWMQSVAPEAAQAQPQTAQAAPAPQAIQQQPASVGLPQRPPGVDAKTWRTEQTKERVKAVNALPNIMDTTTRSLQIIDQIRNHPGRTGFGATGWSADIPGIGQGMPGQPGRGFVRLVDQAGSRAFLEAFNALRGAGQISNAEGEKATSSLARLDRAQSQKDFDEALNDLEDIMRTGIERAHRAAGQTPPRRPQRGQTSIDDLVKKYSGGGGGF